jgi:hypothetical protein
LLLPKEATLGSLTKGSQSWRLRANSLHEGFEAFNGGGSVSGPVPEGLNHLNAGPFGLYFIQIRLETLDGFKRCK